MNTVLMHLDQVEKRLFSLTAGKRIVFIGLCAERLLKTYKAVEQSAERRNGCERAVACIWDSVLTPASELAEVGESLNNILPNSDSIHTFTDEVVDRTISALIEMVSVIQKNRSQMAYLAAQANLEVVIAYYRDMFGVRVVTAESNTTIEKQSLLREEIQRESAELDALSGSLDPNGIKSLRRAAQTVGLLGES